MSITGTSFNVYEVFSAVIVESTETDDAGVKTTTESFDYTVNSDYITFFEDNITDYTYPNADASTDEIDTANNAAMNYINGFYDSENEAKMQELVSLLRIYTLTDDITAKATTTTAVDDPDIQTVFTQNANLLGYYLVLDSSDALSIDGATTDTTSSVSAGMLCNVPARDGDTLSANQHITIKGSAPTISKKIWHNDGTGSNSVHDGSTGAWEDTGDYQVGDTVEFLIKATIPSNLTGYTSESYTYIIEDSMTDGLSFIPGSVAIYKSDKLTEDNKAEGHLHDQLLDEDGIKIPYYDANTYEEDENVLFTYVFNMVAIKEKLPGLKEFYIYYKAIVTEDAKLATDYETNTVELIYSTNPYDKTEVDSVEDSVYSFTFDYDVLKTTGDGVTPLSGAKFALYELNRDGKEGASDQLYLTYNETLSDEYGTEVFAVSETTKDSSTQTLITNAKGKFMLLGLDDNTLYKLVETDAPDGYNAAEPVTFTITADYTYDANGKPIAAVTGASTTTGEIDTTIINTSSALLPSTGGMGTTLLTYGGIVLMVCAGVLLLIKRKNS